MPKEKEKAGKAKKAHIQKIDKMRLAAAAGKATELAGVLREMKDEVDSVQSDSKAAVALNDLPALHLAAQNGHKACCEALLRAGANLERQTTSGLHTPFLLAAAHGHAKVARFLASRNANIEARDREGQSALILAARNGELECVDTLLSLGAKIESKDRGGDTALIMAAKLGKLDVVGFLLSCGASVQHRNASKKCVLDIDNAAVTALVSTAALRKHLAAHAFGAAWSAAGVINAVCLYLYEPPVAAAAEDAEEEEASEASGLESKAVA